MGKNSFAPFAFQPLINQIINQLRFSKPTDIQQEVIPAILEQESVIGQSHTGSGKTHAYLLPLFNQLDETKQEVQFVITSPTRELATQIYDDVKQMIQFANKDNQWTAKLLVGGTDRKKMAAGLQTPPHIVVGTPGRILDLVLSGSLSIYSASSFVIDEADLMFELGFLKEVDQLLVRAKEDIQVLAFSATIPTPLEHMLKKYMKQPLYVKIGDQITPETIEHRLIDLKHREPSKLIVELSKVFQPYLAIIFTNGQAEANELAQSLQESGINAGLIHGGLSPRERRRTLKHIEDLRYQYVVATDLASRGIDIKGVSHVINAQLPKEIDFYIHRVGRTARAGMEGMAISLFTEDDHSFIESLEEHGIPFIFSDVRNGEWIKAKRWNRRTIRRQTKNSQIDREAWKRVKKPKRVKPGYRKKMKKQQQAVKRQLLKKRKKRR